MVLFTAEHGNREMSKKHAREGIGRCWTEMRPKPLSGEPWIFDNGAYLDWVRDKEFNDTAYWKRLWRAYAVGRPYFAVVPDIVAEGKKSLEYSMWWIERLPPSWSWYLAIQDDMDMAEVKAVIKWYDGFFLGGSNDFKQEAGRWCDLAHSKGLKFHYARCGTRKRIAHAKRIGADSIDSAGCLQSPQRYQEVMDAFYETHEQLEIAV